MIQAGIQELLYRVAAEIANAAQGEAPYVTRNLRNDIRVYDDKIMAGEVRVAQSKLAYYAVWVHQGTGLYGPYKTKIVPKRARALKTPWGPRKSVKGQRPNPYMHRAFHAYATGGGLDRALTASIGAIADSVAQKISDAIKDVALSIRL